MSTVAQTDRSKAEGSHVIMVSQPEAVAEVILTASAAVDRVPAAAGGSRMESSARSRDALAHREGNGR